MNGPTLHSALVHWGPYVVLGVAAIAVGLTAVAFAVLCVTHLLGPKTAEDHGGAHHGHHPHG